VWKLPSRAIGVNIVLAQLANLTGYQAAGANRVIRAVNTVIHPGELHLQSVAVGLVTIALILLLERTRLGPLGLVVAVIVTSAAVAALGWGDVATVSGLGDIPRSLPLPVAPLLRMVPSLLVPALSLALVGLVQGAGISASFPNPDGSYPDASRDFIGQGAANVIAGIFRGMPVAGSMSATAVNKAAGARSRLALMIASVVMAVTIVAFAGLVGHIAMPALAGLLILVGWRTIKPEDLAQSAAKSDQIRPGRVAERGDISGPCLATLRFRDRNRLVSLPEWAPCSLPGASAREGSICCHRFSARGRAGRS
jgi:SulP family sulfate permease